MRSVYVYIYIYNTYVYIYMYNIFIYDDHLHRILRSPYYNEERMNSRIIMDIIRKKVRECRISSFVLVFGT